MITPQDLACELLVQLEGCKLIAYLDDGKTGAPTIGIGTTHYPDGTAVQLGDTCKLQQAKSYLMFHLEKYVFPEFKFYPDVPPKIYAACSSFVYNEGHLSLCIKNALSMKQYGRLPDCFRKYIVVKGRISKGLQNRREEEINYFKSEI